MSLNFLRTGNVDDFANQLFVPPADPSPIAPRQKTAKTLWMSLAILSIFVGFMFLYLNSKINNLATPPKSSTLTDVQDVSGELRDMRNVLETLRSDTLRSARTNRYETRKQWSDRAFSDNIENLLSASTAPLVSTRSQTSL